MDAITFFAMQIFLGCVLFWYISNVNARSAGETGFLGLRRDRFEEPVRPETSYGQKTRVRARADASQTRFAERKSPPATDEPRQGHLSEELHAMRPVTLRDIHGNPIAAGDQRAPHPARFRRRDRTQAPTSAPTSVPAGKKRTPRYRSKDRHAPKNVG
ncbi:MAG: hypothetical protein AAGH42_05990 [Pseudomonadota bacterium]